jgi:hypothetical protein
MSRTRKSNDSPQDIAPIRPPQLPVGTPGRGGGRPRLHSEEDTKLQVVALAELLPRLTVTQVHALVRRAKFQAERDGTPLPRELAPLAELTLGRFNWLAKRVQEQWTREDERVARTVVQRRARALRRLYVAAQNARGQRDADGKWVRKPNPMAEARFEELIAKMEGTCAPQEVKVEHRQAEAVATIIGGMTHEQRMKLTREAAEERRKARLFDAMTKVGLEVPELPEHRNGKA